MSQPISTPRTFYAKMEHDTTHDSAGIWIPFLTEDSGGWKCSICDEIIEESGD